MDELTPPLLELGLRGMIGKEIRSQQVIDGMKRYGALYFTAIGGAAALLADSVKKCEVIAYEDFKNGSY